MFKKTIILALLSILAITLLSGCVNSAMRKDVNDSYDANKALITDKYKNFNKQDRFVVHKSRYTSDSMVAVHPVWEKQQVELHAYQQPLAEVMNALTRNVPSVRVVYNGDMAKTPVNINYKGSLKDALQHLMHKNNIYFAIQGASQDIIRWSNTETKTFDIAFMPGTTSFSVGGSTGSVGVGNGGNSNSASLAGKVSVWDDIKSTVEKMLSKNGQLNISQSASTVTVIDKPHNIERIGAFIKNYNKVLSLRVTMHIKILEVQLNKQHRFGIDWNLIYRGQQLGGLTGNIDNTLPGFALNAISPSSNGVTSQTSLSPSPGLTSSSAFINALDTQGKTSVVDEPTITTLNNSPSTISVVTKKVYIKSSDATTTGSGDTATTEFTVTPADIVTGLKMTLIPHIQGDKIYLSIDGNLSSLRSLTTKTFGNSKNGTSMQIELPEVNSKTFNQRVMTLNQHLIILSGLRTEDKRSDNTKNFGSETLGSNNDLISYKELIVLIKPEIIK